MALWISVPDTCNHPDKRLSHHTGRCSAYVMKELLNQLWHHTDRIATRAWCYQWYRLAIDSGIQPLIRFAKSLSVHIEGLLSHTRYRLTTGVLEGMNNKIKVIKRVTYGFRDDQYFFLRIRHVFSGNRR